MITKDKMLRDTISGLQLQMDNAPTPQRKRELEEELRKYQSKFAKYRVKENRLHLLTY